VVLSTTKTGRYDITEILLKVALNTINQSEYFVINKDDEDGNLPWLSSRERF
jgi:hypothetical protein